MNKNFFATAALAAMALAVHAQQDTTRVSRLDEVVVTGTRTTTTQRNLPVTVSVVNRETLTAQQRTNVLPTLGEHVPGLFITQRGMMGFGVSGGAAGGINLRGISAGAGRLLVLIDGHPQYQGVFGHSISDSYQTMMTERVEVLRGPASVLYGSNAMGGVVNIVTRQPKEDGSRTHVNLGAGSWGTVQAEVSNQTRVGKFSSTVAAQYGRSDNHRPDMGFEQYGGFVKLGYDINDNWNAFADLDLTHFNSSYPGSEDSPLLEADQWITRGVAMLGIENKYEKTNGRLSVYDNFGIHKINDGYAPGKTPQTELFRSKDALAGVSWYQTMSLLEGNSITVGVDYQHIYGRAYYTNRETGEIVTSGKRGMQSGHAHSNEIAGYVDVRQDIAPWLTVDAGIRYDHHSVAGSEWVPQVGVVIRPLADGELKLMASKGFRNPTTKDMYLYAVANRDSLRAERMWNYELAWHQTLMEGAFSYGVNLFFMQGDNLIQAVAGRNINTGDFINKGIEGEMALRVNSHLRLTTNHSYLYMHKPIEGSPRYKGYLGADSRFGKWTIAAGLQHIAGLYTTATERTNFTLLNASVGYQLCPTLQLWAKGDNLLAQKYEINAGYPMPRATFMAGVNLSL